MSFKATLKLGESEYDVLSCSYAFRRDTDIKGRPSSIVYGGDVNINIESTDDTSVIEAMINNQHKPVAGTITWTQAVADGTLKVLSFENAFIVAYSESFSAGGGDAMQINFTVSAEIITIGGAELSNDWPVKK